MIMSAKNAVAPTAMPPITAPEKTVDFCAPWGIFPVGFSVLVVVVGRLVTAEESQDGGPALVVANDAVPSLGLHQSVNPT